MKPVSLFALSVFIVSCGIGEAPPCEAVQQLITRGPIQLGPQMTHLQLDSTLWAPGPPLQVRVRLPDDSRCVGSNGVLTSAGDSVRLSGTVTIDGTRHALQAFIGEARCREIALFVDLPKEPARRVTGIELASATKLEVPRIAWWSGPLCLAPR